MFDADKVYEYIYERKPVTLYCSSHHSTSSAAQVPITMNYRALGPTKLQISELGFGCGGVGGLFVRGAHREMVTAVERAIDLGINYFDTASIYGDGRSEANLGAVLQELDADVLVGTKVRLTTSELTHIQDAVMTSVATSLARLRVDRIDLIQLHNPIGRHRDAERGVIGVSDVPPVLDAFEKLQDSGQVEYFGINGLGDTDAVHRAIEMKRTQSIQVCYNLINPSARHTVPTTFPFQDYRRLIQKAAAIGAGVIVIRVLAGGALSGSPHRHPIAATTVTPIATSMKFSDDGTRAQAFQYLVDEGYTSNLVEAAIRFAISNPLLSTALVGFSSVAHLDAAARYVAEGTLPSNAVQRIVTTQTW